MTYVFGALAGLVWGALAAYVNYLVMKKCVAKNSNNALLGGNFLRTLVDLAALGIIFLLRNVLPFSFEACLIATAAILGLGTVYFSFKIARS